VQNHGIDLADALARRAELRRELDDLPSEVRGLIERHEKLRALEHEDPVENAEDFYARTMPSGMAPQVVWEIVEGQPAQRVEIEHSWGGVSRRRPRSRRSSRPLAAVRGPPT